MAKQKTKPKQSVLGARFSANMTRFRKRHDMTMGDVAKAAGVSPAYVSLIENNARDPHLATIELFAKVFNKTPLEMLR